MELSLDTYNTNLELNHPKVKALMKQANFIAGWITNSNTLFIQAEVNKEIFSLKESCKSYESMNELYVKTVNELYKKLCPEEN